MRILVAGDTHCNLPWALHLLDKAIEFECEVIYVLGDFGYWPGWNSGRNFLYKIEHELKKVRIPLYWLDGNHEDHNELNKLVPRVGGIVNISSHIHYTPRGCTWIWDDLKFVALGGATSIDMKLREVGISWFEQESITEENVIHAKTAGSADILFSHDAPLSIILPAKIPISFVKKDSKYRTEIEKLSWNNRKKVEEVAAALGVKRIYHGHHHYAYRSEIDITGKWIKVEGLACHQMKGAWTILDTEDL